MADDFTSNGASMVQRLHGLAEFAFGSLTHADAVPRDQPLALLHVESLELDLSDPAQRQFGDYELLERIGEGGMGVVYRARHVPLDRIVAVKLLSAGPWASREFIERFEREARNAARMQHPNIVTVFEVGNHDGLHFFSMRLVEGQSLSALLKGGKRYAPREAAVLLRTVAEAVAYAHSLGVLHLDLKPGNVLIDEQGVPYVADFGLARRIGRATAVRSDEVSGTPSYMAPEQAQLGACNLTAATDIWGLGAILYELLTGEPPFRGRSAKDILELVLHGRVCAPRRMRPMLPRDLEAIVMRCFNHDPNDRYPSARMFADDLSRFVEGRPVQARPLNAAQRVVRWARREPKLAASLACAVLVLVIGLVATSWQWHHARHNAALAQDNATLAEHTLWKARSEAAQRRMQRGDAWTALASVLANLRDMQATSDRKDAALERLRIGTVLANAPQLLDAIPIGADHQITAMAFSPDGKSLAEIIDGGTIRLVDVASGRQRWQVQVRAESFGMTRRDLNQSGLDVHFSNDGRRLIGRRVPGISASGINPVLYPHEVDSVLIDVATGKQVAPPKSFPDFLAVDYSDDGRYALLFDKHGGVQRWRTLPWAADGDLVHIEGDIASSSQGTQLAGEARLTRDDTTMVLVDTSRLRFRSFDAAHMRLRQTLVLTTDQDRATAWALRHAGNELAIGTTSGQLAVWNPVTGKATWLHARFNSWISRLRFSAGDSRLLAVSSEPSEMRVFDTRTLEPVAVPVALSDAVDEGDTVDGDFGPDADTILTRDFKTTATVWWVPDPGFPLHLPVAAAPPMVALYARFALATDPRSRLMATSDNHLLKLWRVRWTPYVGGIAAPMVSDTLRFDGHHLVSADGKVVGVFDVATGRNVGKTIVLPQAPTFAGLDGSGTRLIAIAGRELSCWNWRDARPCWPAITLPDSALRLSLAAHAPVMAVSTGSNEHGMFFEHVRIIDLATGRQRGAPIAVRGPLGALRLSDDGRRLLIYGDVNIYADDSDVLRVVDTRTVRVRLSLVHPDKPRARLIDARFADDGSIWSLTGPARWGAGSDPKLWHWTSGGKPIGKPVPVDGPDLAVGGLLPLPHGRGVIETSMAMLFAGAPLKAEALSVVPDRTNHVNSSALSPDGHLLALATLSGVGLYVIDRDQRLVPDFKLALPNHDAVQQLAFSPDGTRLVGRTLAGHWFAWRIASDGRPVDEIARDLALRDFTNRDSIGQAAVLPPSTAERRAWRAADPGPAPSSTLAAPANLAADAPVADPRYRPLDMDPIANVEPRTRMNRMARMPVVPQALPTLPRGLQRYAGVDFLLGRGVQLSGTPLNPLNTVFPAQSQPLRITPQRIAVLDALVFQFYPSVGEVGAVRLHYADGGETVLPILQDRDTRALLDTRPTGTSGRRIGWLGTYAMALHGRGMDYQGAMTVVRTDVVRLANPEPDRPVASITLEAPPNASPGLLFLALTLEPVRPVAETSGIPAGESR